MSCIRHGLRRGAALASFYGLIFVGLKFGVEIRGFVSKGCKASLWGLTIGMALHGMALHDMTVE